MEQRSLLPLDIIHGPGGSPDTFNSLAQRAAACTKCSELVPIRTQPVIGGGRLARPLVALIGTAPQMWEDIEGGPFVGPAGEVLGDALRRADFNIEGECFFANLVCCRTPGDRLPSLGEAGNCMEFLAGQLTIVRPRVIVALGALPTLFLQEGGCTIGAWVKWRGTPVLASIRPRRGCELAVLVAHLKAARARALELWQQEEAERLR